MKVLTITSNSEMLRDILHSFEQHWPETVIISVNEGNKGIELVKAESPQMILLDLMLPDTNGFEVLSQIRSFSNVPIIIVASRGRETDRVKCLEMGADDYMIKPFSYNEMLARVKAVVRRTSREHAVQNKSLSFEGLVINLTSGEITFDGKEIELTSIEYKLLCQLAINCGRTVSQRTLLSRTWGEGYLDKPDFLETHIERLQKKLRDTSDNRQLIFTVPGIGYRLGNLESSLKPTFNLS